MVGSVRPAMHAPLPGRWQTHSTWRRASEARWRSETGPSPAREPIGESTPQRFNKPIEWHLTAMPTMSDTQVSAWLEDRHLDYHRRQFAEPYRSTAHLCRFVRRILGSGAETECGALDVVCGAGANIFHLSRVLTRARWTGVDIAGQL